MSFCTIEEAWGENFNQEEKKQSSRKNNKVKKVKKHQLNVYKNSNDKSKEIGYNDRLLHDEADYIDNDYAAFNNNNANYEINTYNRLKKNKKKIVLKEDSESESEDEEYNFDYLKPEQEQEQKYYKQEQEYKQIRQEQSIKTSMDDYNYKLDIFLYIFSGITLIFIMDTFVKMGMAINMKKLTKGNIDN